MQFMITLKKKEDKAGTKKIPQMEGKTTNNINSLLCTALLYNIPFFSVRVTGGSWGEYGRIQTVHRDSRILPESDDGVSSLLRTSICSQPKGTSVIQGAVFCELFLLDNMKFILMLITALWYRISLFLIQGTFVIQGAVFCEWFLLYDIIFVFNANNCTMVQN